MPAFYVTCPQNKKMSRSIQAHFSLLQIHICVIWQECTVLQLTKHVAAAATEYMHVVMISIIRLPL